MSNGRKMLLETLVGHLALLETSYPRKANTRLAKATQRYVKSCLRRPQATRRLAA